MNRKITKFKNLLKKKMSIPSDEKLFEFLLWGLATKSANKEIRLLAKEAKLL